MPNSIFKPLLSRVTLTSIVEAMRHLYPHRAYLTDLDSPDPERVLFGQAIIISYLPLRKDRFDPKVHNFARAFYQAVEDQPQDKVLVLATQGNADASVADSVELSRVQLHGLSGILTDGRLNNFNELNQYDFASYCAGESAESAANSLMPFEVNVPVVLEGITIFPFDFIYADSGGAVIIPADDIKRVLDEAVKIESSKQNKQKSIEDENPEEILKQETD